MFSLLSLLLVYLFIARSFCSESDDIDICNQLNPPANEEDCSSVNSMFTVSGYKCCFIKGKSDGLLVRACSRVLDTEQGIDTFKEMIKSSTDTHISIHCSSSYLINAVVILITLLF